MVTNEQLYLAIGVPVILNIAFNGFMFLVLNGRIGQLDTRLTQLEASLKEMWRAELRRVEEVLDARLRHLEERFR